MWCKFKNYLTILCPFNQLIQFNDRCSYNSIPPDQHQNIKQEPAGSSSGSTNIKPLFSCGVVWTGGESESHGRLALYISFIYMFGFVLPLLVISTSYLKIIKTIRKDLLVKELKLTTSLQIESKAVRVNKVKCEADQGPETDHHGCCHGIFSFKSFREGVFFLTLSLECAETSRNEKKIYIPFDGGLKSQKVENSTFFIFFFFTPSLRGFWM